MRIMCVVNACYFQCYSNYSQMPRADTAKKKNARYYPVLLCVVCLAPCEWHRCWLLFLHMKHAHDICERAISNWNYSKCEEKKTEINWTHHVVCYVNGTRPMMMCAAWITLLKKKKNSTQTTRPTTLAKRRNWSILLLKNSCVKRVCDPCNRCGILAEAAAAIIAIIQWRLAQRNSTFRTACN